MAKQAIGIGTIANDGTGDPIRTAFDKCNDNFTELYNGLGTGHGILIAGSDAQAATQAIAKYTCDGTNDEVQINAAISDLGSRGVIYLAGTFEASGITLTDRISIVGIGRSAKITAPASAASPMFTTGAGATFFGGGLYGLELDGNDKANNGVDFSNLTQLTQFMIHDCYLHDFDIAIRGSGAAGAGDDRYAIVDHSLVQDNNTGIYTQEHMVLRYVDVRGNTTGITGRLYDFRAIGTNVNYNTTGVDYVNNHANSFWANCNFYKNTTLAMKIIGGVQVTGCYFVGTGSADRAIEIEGPANLIQNNKFGISGSTNRFANGCLYFSTTNSAVRNKIQNNIFECDATPILGVANHAPSYISITGNTFILNDCEAINNMNASGGYTNSVINDNVIYYGGTTGTNVLFDLFTATATIQGNTFASDGGTFAAFIGGSLTRAYIIGNTFRSSGSTTFIESAAIQSDTCFRDNHGYVTRNIGTATVTNGTTSIAVTHGLARTPTAGEIQVTPTESIAGAARFWVDTITSTQFTINVDSDPGTDVTFGWHAEILNN